MSIRATKNLLEFFTIISEIFFYVRIFLEKEEVMERLESFRVKSEMQEYVSFTPLEAERFIY